MLDYAREAISLAGGHRRADLDSNRMLNLSLTRLLEVLGEAARRVPDDTRAHYPGIPWPQIVGLRSRLIHDYDNVDFDILWSIVTQDLPALVGDLERGLSDPSSPAK